MDPHGFAPTHRRLNTHGVIALRNRVRRSGYRHTSGDVRGFSLVELMTVVVITGILATIGFAALRSHVNAAWGAEALNMVQSIRAAEERWRSEHMMYLNVSTDNNSWYPRNPTVTAKKNTHQTFFYAPTDGTHPDNLRWLLLRPATSGPVRFGYLVNAGSAGDTMTAPARGPAVTWPTTTDNWYVIQALGDADWDGVTSYYRATSIDGDVFTLNHGE
jgi:prepilin-type N-terminal cleavage/methylation domain-containing protein